MDITKNNKSLFLYAFITIIIAFLCCAFITKSNFSANAITFLELNTITVEVLDTDKVLSQGVAEYNIAPYEGVSYGRNIRIKYNLFDVCYLKFATQVGEGMTVAGDFIATNGLDDYTYLVDIDGIVNVICYAYDNDKTQLSTCVNTVRSDTSAPNSFANVSQMTDYVGDIDYNVIISWDNFGDELSGKGNVFYSFDYYNATSIDIAITEVDIAYSDTTNVYIRGNGELKIFYFDKAGNGIARQYTFDKFDLIPPPKPKITITPNVDTTLSNGFAKEYTVTIEYFDDAQSGNAEVQYYILNNVTMPYHQSFVLKDGRNYTIKAYTSDRVGNRSVMDTVNIDWESFDTVPPNVINKELIIDLTKPTIATLSIIATDSESGVANALLDSLSKPFIEGVSSVYRVEFSPYNLSSLVFKVFDRVGNVAIEHYVINYFDNEKLCERLISYNTLYLELDRSLFNEVILTQLESEYALLSTMLISTKTQDNDFYNAMSKIDKLIEGKSEHTYEISAVPIVVSTMLSFKIQESDFPTYKLGDSVKVVLGTAVSNGKNYVAMSGYKKGFADYFSLALYYKGNEVSKLERGIEITMNLPTGYYERQFTLINIDTDEIVNATIINNQIIFNCKENTNFALVLSGNREIALTNPTKYIKLFGKKMDYGTFFGVVFGVIGGAVLIVAAILIIKKKSKMVN